MGEVGITQCWHLGSTQKKTLINKQTKTYQNPKKHMFTAAEYLVSVNVPPTRPQRGDFFQEEFASWQQREKTSGPFRGRPRTGSKTSLKPGGENRTRSALCAVGSAFTIYPGGCTSHLPASHPLWSKQPSCFSWTAPVAPSLVSLLPARPAPFFRGAAGGTL